MDRLPPSTLRRLKQLPQLQNSVWEGDRIQLNAKVRDPDRRGSQSADCILWVDGVEQTVRTIEPIPLSDGPEAYVRGLIKAMEAPMEMPQMPMAKVRPQKVIVRTRELQFFLRGILKELDIQVEFHSDLPLIDEMAPSLRQLIGTAEDNLADELYELLEEKADQIWETAPWQVLLDHHILEVNISLFGQDPFYLSVMGNLGMEYGLLLYRSVESLKTFREAALRTDEEDMRQMQLAFMSQDCLFVNFEPAASEPEGPLNIMQLLQNGPDELEDIEIAVGSINPIEGIRPELHEEEAITLIVALEAIHRFFRKNRRQFQNENFPDCSSRFRIALPAELMPETVSQKTVSVQISSQPELADELWDMVERLDAAEPPGGDEDEFLSEMGDLRSLLQGLPGSAPAMPLLKSRSIEILDELVPEGSITMIGRLEWDLYDRLIQTPKLRKQANSGRLSRKGEGFPIFIVQASQAKAKQMIKQIDAAGGISRIGFVPMRTGSGPKTSMEASVVQLAKGDVNIVNDYELDDPMHRETKKRWERYTQASKGRCGFIVAKTTRGKRQGHVGFESMLAFYETQLMNPEDLLKS